MNFFGSVFSGVRRRNRREDRRRSGEEREEEEMEEEEEEKESGTKTATTPGDTQIHHERKAHIPQLPRGHYGLPLGICVTGLSSPLCYIPSSFLPGFRNS